MGGNDCASCGSLDNKRSSSFLRDTNRARRRLRGRERNIAHNQSDENEVAESLFNETKIVVMSFKQEMSEPGPACEKDTHTCIHTVRYLKITEGKFPFASHMEREFSSESCAHE